MAGARETCCICGRELPNRWSVAGRCDADGCGAAFCAFHWHAGNGKCPAHGWRKDDKTGCKGGIGMSEQEAMSNVPGVEVVPAGAEAAVERPAMKKTAAMAALNGTVALGKSAVAYFKKLCGIRDPKAALAEAEAQLAAVRDRREPLSERYEELYFKIASKKKLRDGASAARRKMLDMELRTLLAEYKSLEREVAALYRKEEMIVTVRGRMNELVVQGLPMPRVEDVDRLADDIADAMDADEDLADAVSDLDKIGVGRERHPVDLDEELAEFGESGGEETVSETSQGTPETPGAVEA